MKQIRRLVVATALFQSGRLISSVVSPKCSAAKTMADVTILLSADEALVLFAFLSRYSEHGLLAIQDQAEQRALWNLQCLLERHLVEPFSPDYGKLLAKARHAIRDDCS